MHLHLRILEASYNCSSNLLTFFRHRTSSHQERGPDDDATHDHECSDHVDAVSVANTEFGCHRRCSESVIAGPEEAIAIQEAQGRGFE